MSEADSPSNASITTPPPRTSRRTSPYPHHIYELSTISSSEPLPLPRIARTSSNSTRTFEPRPRRQFTPYVMPHHPRISENDDAEDGAESHPGLVSTVANVMHEPETPHSPSEKAPIEAVRKDLSPILMRDIIMGFSDGLTVPFALTAGLSATAPPRVILMAGLAEIVAGSFSMGLGAYMAATTERTHYRVVEVQVRNDIKGDVTQKTIDLLQNYGTSGAVAYEAAREMTEDGEGLVKFLLDCDVRLEKPEGRRGMALEGLACGLSYAIGGILPMTPYFFLSGKTKSSLKALYSSIVIACVLLAVFGYFKGRWSQLSRRASLVSAAHMLFVGAVAAGASYGVVKGLDALAQKHQGKSSGQA